MDRRVAHDALLADLVPRGLELRLDERDQPRAGPGEGERHRQHFRQRDKAGIADDQVDGFGNMLRGQDTRARLFMDDDAVVLPQLPRELVGPRIDGMDAAHAAVQQHVGKAASRRAAVDPALARYVPPHMPPPKFHRVIELAAAPRPPPMLSALPPY